MKIVINHYLAAAFLFINESCTEKSMQETFHFSDYELKKTISAIIELAPHFGAKVYETKFLISYIIIDQKLFSDYYYLLRAFYYRNINNSTFTQNIFYNTYIGLKLLISNEAVNMDLISAELYRSRSALRYNLQWIKKFFYNYHLNIYNKPHYGLIAIGNEFYKRYAMIALIGQLDVRIFNNDFFNSCTQLIYNDFYIRSRNILREFASESTTTISLGSSRILAYYLTIQRSRSQNRPILTPALSGFKQVIIRSHSYAITKMLYSQFYEKEELPLEDEMISFFILYMAHKEEYSEDEQFLKEIGIEKSSEILYKSVKAYLREKLKISDLEDYYNDLIGTEIKRLMLKHQFHILNLRMTNLGGRKHLFSNPVLIMILNSLKGIVNEMLQEEELPPSHFGVLLSAIERKFQFTKIPCLKSKIALISRDNERELSILKCEIERLVPSEYYSIIQIIPYRSYRLDMYSDYLFITDTVPEYGPKLKYYVLPHHQNQLNDLLPFIKNHREFYKIYIDSQIILKKRTEFSTANGSSVEKDYIINNCLFLFYEQEVPMKIQICITKLGYDQYIGGKAVTNVVELNFYPDEYTYVILYFICKIFISYPELLNEQNADVLSENINQYLCESIY
ncbi:hypothetical protein [Dielma fastidiosa]|nr:hypothetical protein [Dielma fastidiosa]